MKLKNVFIFSVIIFFLGSCKPYKSISEKKDVTVASSTHETYTFIKKFRILYRKNWTYPEIPIHKCVFSKGTKYKFILEKGIKSAKLYKANSRKAIIEFYPKLDDNEFIFQCGETNVYNLKAITNVENEIVMISLYFSRSDSTNSK
jgi:hypothetical protein